MDEREFTGRIAGEVRSAYGQYVYFHPHELPFDIRISERIRRRSISAIASLSRLDGRASEMSEAERGIFLKAFALKESAHSSSIEGTRSTMDDLYRYEKEPPVTESNLRDAQEVLNYKDALDLGLRRLASGGRIDVMLLHDMHRTLMKGVRGENKSPGEFKSSQNAIGRAGDTLDTAKMVPAPPEAVEYLIENLLAYADSEEDPIIKTAILHYQFESIHPYRDGNGRMGRMLILLMLAKEGILHYPVIYPSEYFDRRRDEYIDRLFDVSSKDMFEEWLDFFIDAMTEQASESSSMMDGLKSYRRRLRDLAGTKLELEVCEMLFSNPYVRSADVMETCGVSNPTATKVLAVLEGKGVLREITGKTRNKLYSADAVLEILARRR